MVDDPSAASEPARWIKLRASAAERARWQALATSRGVSLSELIRASLGGLRLRPRRAPPPVAPELLRELARIGNNLNQLARAANRHEPVTATALLARLIAIDRELGALRAAHTRADGGRVVAGHLAAAVRDRSPLVADRGHAAALEQELGGLERGIGEAKRLDHALGAAGERALEQARELERAHERVRERDHGWDHGL